MYMNSILDPFFHDTDEDILLASRFLFFFPPPAGPLGPGIPPGPATSGSEDSDASLDREALPAPDDVPLPI
jgi:hypothetical protein